MKTATSNQLESLFIERFPESKKLDQNSKQIFPNGVTHDSRHLKPFPIFVEQAKGCRKTTVEGHELIDFWMGHGSLLLGHGHPAIVDAVQQQVERGTHFAACHEQELHWAELVKQLVPSAEKVRFTSSGTEATLMAIRIARIATGRAKVLKFAGHFHGWHDQLILAADATKPDGDWSQPGITSAVQNDLVVVPPNNLAAVKEAIEAHRPACVILEPTGGRWGTVPIRGEFLRQLRELTKQTETILICDEVITGFRVAPGGAQEAYEIDPDLTTLAKILAGGLPGGCLTGRADLLEYLEYDNPSGQKMKHPGTYNGNPLSAVAGIAALEEVSSGEPCRVANERAVQFRQQLNDLFVKKNVDWVAYGDFSLTKILPGYFGERPENEEFLPYENDAAKIDAPVSAELSHAFRCALLLNGVDLMGWGAIMSAVHSEADLDEAVNGFERAIHLLRQDGFID